MFFSHWFRRSHRSAPSYRPEICLLEERAVPALLRVPPVPVTPVATHYAVIVPQNVAAGTAFNVIVEALDAHNKIVTNAQGTVTIGLGTADAGAVIPAAFKFSVSDHGKHIFKATLAATGAQQVTAAKGTLAGSASFIVNAPVTHFSVTALGKPTVGTAALVNVVALDANNNPVPGYTGTIHFTTSGFVTYPLPDYTFTVGDSGSHLFSVTFASAGSQTLAVNDSANGSIVGGTQIKVVSGWSSYYGGYSSYFGSASYPYSPNYYAAAWGYPASTFSAPISYGYYY
jgi:hypothetical protein